MSETENHSRLITCEILGSTPGPATKKFKNIWRFKKSSYICKTKQNNLKIEIMTTFETYYYEAYEEHSATGDTMSVKS